MSLTGLAGNGGVFSAKHKYLYLPDGWDDTWQAAKAAAGSSPAWITFLTDSLGNGQGSSDWMNKSWTGKVRAGILQSFSLYGDYWGPRGYSAASITALGSTFAGTPPWVASQPAGSTLAWAGNKLPAGGEWFWDGPAYWAWGTGGTGVLATFSPPSPCTAVDLFVVNYAAGTLQYRVDGGSWQNIVTTGTDASANSANNVFRVPITSLANTTHTVDIGNWTPNTNAQHAMVQGAAAYASTTAGIGFARIGNCGVVAADYLSSSGSPTKPLDLWTGKSPQNDATAVGTGTFGFPMNPHLFILQLGINDCTSSISVGSSSSNYDTAIRKLVRAVRRARKNASVMIVVPCFPDSLYSDSVYSSTYTAWIDYATAMRRVAELENCALVDVHAKWGLTPFADGLITANNDIHPTDAGHADIANLVLSAL